MRQPKEVLYNNKNLQQILDDHALWWKSKGEEGFQANLWGANLWEVNLWGVNLQKANLEGANLQKSNLQRSNLEGANLQRSNLEGANFWRANFWRANLQEANLQETNLEGANLGRANLGRANLEGANLPLFQLVPEEGDFIAWKKVRDDIVLKLLITGKRTSSLIGRNCRCSEAKVLEAFGAREGQIIFQSDYDKHFTYEIGKTVTCPDYDDDIRIECTEGIHFFITRKEAEDYNL